MTQIRLLLSSHGQRAEYQRCHIQKLLLIPMAKGHTRFAALFDVSMVLCNICITHWGVWVPCGGDGNRPVC